MAAVYKRSLNSGHKRYTKWQDIKDLEAQKTTSPKSVETVWNYIANVYTCKIIFVKVL